MFTCEYYIFRHLIIASKKGSYSREILLNFDENLTALFEQQHYLKMSFQKGGGGGGFI